MIKISNLRHSIEDRSTFVCDITRKFSLGEIPKFGQLKKMDKFYSKIPPSFSTNFSRRDLNES
jgi:hypothetical protein